MLICAATLAELSACGAEVVARASINAELPFALDTSGKDAYLLTGVGIPAVFEAFASVPAELWTEIDGLLNIGIAGAYPNSGMAIGDIVVAEGEVYGDVGMELPADPGFQFLIDTPFASNIYRDTLPAVRPGWALKEAPSGYRLHARRGCTVNACTGTEATGVLRASRFGAGFETMEGAAVAQIARRYHAPFSEIRAISNIAALRDMRPENIRLALTNLSLYLETCRPVSAV